MAAGAEACRLANYGAANRRKAPVFVLGCPRSGTTWLYHLLLSAGSFAMYHAESNVFNLLAPRFGSLRSARDREELMAHWIRSGPFRASGLDAAAIRAKIIAECRNAGDFLRITMQAIAESQGVERWADCTPDHLLHIPEIKRTIPDALVIHIIRDGRDVALSYVKQGWAYPLRWDRGEQLSVAGLYWEWFVRRGREYGRMLGDDYQEVHFEELVAQPHETLARLSRFIGQDLDYERIQQVGVGSVQEPNSSFPEESGEQFNPTGRWKTRMSAEEIDVFENLCGEYLAQLGYPLASRNGRRRRNLHAWRMRTTYLLMFVAKQWCKTRTPLGRHIHIGRLLIEG